MAYWQHKVVKGHKYVVIYTRVNGKPKQLPREQTKHLDGEPEHNIDQWVRNWEAQFENKKVQRDNLLLSDDQLSKYLVAYITAKKDERLDSPTTYKQHESMLRRFVIPFFLSKDPPLRDPQQWPGATPRFTAYLTSKGVSPAVIFRAKVALRGFYEYMRFQGIVQHEAPLRLASNPKKGMKRTPLKYTLTPEAVLSRPFSNTMVRLMGLLGFFFSLRPQEVVALKPKDFRTGSGAKNLECCKVMDAHGLYSKFAVNIQNQMTISGLESAKSGSVGLVACFNERAAIETVEILQSLPKDELIFSAYRLDWWRALWNREGLPGLTLKDLRRASLYWLGHYGGLDIVSLRNHARHSSLETTGLYVRRPGVDLLDEDKLDLDA